MLRINDSYLIYSNPFSLGLMPCFCCSMLCNVRAGAEVDVSRFLIKSSWLWIFYMFGNIFCVIMPPPHWHTQNLRHPQTTIDTFRCQNIFPEPSRIRDMFRRPRSTVTNFFSCKSKHIPTASRELFSQNLSGCTSTFFVCAKSQRIDLLAIWEKRLTARPASCFSYRAWGGKDGGKKSRINWHMALHDVTPRYHFATCEKKEGEKNQRILSRKEESPVISSAFNHLRVCLSCCVWVSLSQEQIIFKTLNCTRKKFHWGFRMMVMVVICCLRI